jgi:hypothetical protein
LFVKFIVVFIFELYSCFWGYASFCCGLINLESESKKLQRIRTPFGKAATGQKEEKGAADEMLKRGHFSSVEHEMMMTTTNRAN